MTYLCPVCDEHHDLNRDNTFRCPNDHKGRVFEVQWDGEWDDYSGRYVDTSTVVEVTGDYNYREAA